MVRSVGHLRTSFYLEEGVSCAINPRALAISCLAKHLETVPSFGAAQKHTHTLVVSGQLAN